MSSQLNTALIRKLRGPLMCVAYCLDMLSVGMCTTRHKQTSVRLVQDLNVSTVISAFESLYKINAQRSIQLVICIIQSPKTSSLNNATYNRRKL